MSRQHTLALIFLPASWASLIGLSTLGSLIGYAPWERGLLYTGVSAFYLIAAYSILKLAGPSPATTTRDVQRGCAIVVLALVILASLFLIARGLKGGESTPWNLPSGELGMMVQLARNVGVDSNGWIDFVICVGPYFFMSAIAVPIIEEVLFARLLLTKGSPLSKSAVTANLLCGGLFVITHLIGRGTASVELCLIWFSLRYLYNFAYQWTGLLWVSVAIHGYWNLAVVLPSFF